MTYTTNLLIYQPTPGGAADTNTWGTSLNNKMMALFDSAIAGVLSLSVAGSSNVVLTSTQGVADQARNQHFVFTGILTGNIYVLWPNGLDRSFSVANNTTGSFTLTCAVDNGAGSPAGTGIAVDQNTVASLVSDGTDVKYRALPAGFYTFTGPASTIKTFTLPNANETIACLGQQNAFTKQQYFAQATLTDASSISWDLQAAQSATVTLGGNRTLSNPTNAVAGATYLLRVKQDATGSRTLAYGNNYKFPGGFTPTLTTTANAVDLLAFYYDGTNMLGTSQLNFS